MKQDYVILKGDRLLKGGAKGLLMKDYTVMLLSSGENTTKGGGFIIKIH